MPDELQELHLDTLDVDDSGKIVVLDKPLEPTGPPRNIKGSASLIEDYRSCPAKAYARITRQPSEKSVSLILGSAVHEGLERYVKYEEDPYASFETYLRIEGEKNSIALDNAAGAEAIKVGTACVGAGVGLLEHPGTSGIPLRKRLDQEYIEKFFIIERNGRKYSGKIDFVMFLTDPKNYVIGDWKTGKNAPTESKLKVDLQFSMYAYATMNDPQLRTFGRMMTHGVYVHLRGQSQELHDSGRRKAIKDTKDLKLIKYDFKVKRTEEQVETAFATKIEPVMAAMEAGIWYRNEGTFANPCSYCSFHNKSLDRCEAEIPADKIGKYPMRNTVIDLIEQIGDTSKPADNGMLFGPEVIEQSRKSGLKPYNA